MRVVIKEMQLKPNVGSDRSWVYTAFFDMSEGEPTNELIAVRFANAENANLFKESFERAQKINSGEAVEDQPEDQGESKNQEEQDAKKYEAKKDEITKDEAAKDAAHTEHIQVEDAKTEKSDSVATE